MCNEVWVRWKGSTTSSSSSSSDYWVFDTVTDLKDDAQIKDLRKAFVKQQGLLDQVSPAEVAVRETTEDGEEILKASTPLVTYFAPPTGAVAASSPGKSEDTALFLTYPPLARSALERIEKKLNDMASVDIPMSEATMNFTSSLLDDLKIKYIVRKVNNETGEGVLVQYPWGEKEHEADGQPGCQRILEGEMLPLDFDGASLGIYDVRNHLLPELQAGKRKSNGFSDLAVGPVESMAYAVANAKDLVLSYAVALVELKTGRADLKQGQLLLQLVSLALVSGTGQGVVVLGTDCATKWRLLHFSSYNTVVVQPYTHGKKCIADFKNLIGSSTARMQQNAAREKLTSILRDDSSDVDMKDFGVEETDRDKAIEREAKLRKLAGALGSLFRETLEVPSWAKASETCPSYYT